ncbi:MAG: hypothetical protein JWM00_128 [Candidatus Saccharibacteria bacterium]|nr:hypothetical protein [Candidatus Saccharibacteria bacterium]
MKIKQKTYIVTSAFMLMAVLSLLPSATSFAMTKSEFKDTVCSWVQGPGAEKTCRKSIDDTGEYAVGATGITLKFSDWNDKTPAELEAYLTEQGGSEPTPAASGCAGVDTAIINCNADNSGDLEKNGVWALLLMAINILTAGIGIAAVGGVVYGSIMYTTAGDNEAQVKQAKEIIRNVVIGVMAYIAMYALLQFIVPGGIFS